MNPTKIEWCDFTWNPLKTKCRHGCWYCYAQGIYGRFGRYSDNPNLDEKELLSPAKRKKGSKIFAGSMTDILGDWVPDHMIESIIDVCGKSPQHTFIFLTKNPRRYSHFTWPSNCWLGVSASDQISYDVAAAFMRQYIIKRGRTANRLFVSIEPMLRYTFPYNVNQWDWVIVGALTGRHKASHPVSGIDVIQIIKECGLIDVPVFVKDNVGISSAPQEWPGEPVDKRKGM